MPAIQRVGRYYRAQLRFGRLLERCVFGGLLLLLLWLPLPFGSHRPWAEQLFVLAVAVLLMIWSLSWALSNVRLRHLGAGMALISTVWVLWLCWIWAQTLPWPQETIAAWSPLRWQQVQEAARFSGASAPAQIALSLDRELTQAQLWLSAGYALLFLLFVLCLHQRHRFKWLLWVLLLSGLAQASYGSLMLLSGLEYGAWGAKQAYRGFATGTFVNRNHFAGYLEICLGAAVGLVMATSVTKHTAVDWRQRLRRFLAMFQDGPLFARASIAFLFVGLLLSQSRTGNAAAVAGLVMTAIVYLLCRPRGQTLRWLLLLGSILLIDILLLGRWFGLEQLAERYATVQPAADLRLLVLHDLEVMIPAYSPLGSGLGTFQLAYPQFRSPEVNGLFDHAHNDYAQFLIETGRVGAALLAILVLLTVLRAALIIRRRHDPPARGVACAALIAIGALAVHSAADFNLQIPANAATLVVLMAAVWACGTQSSVRRVPRRKQNISPGSVL